MPSIVTSAFLAIALASVPTPDWVPLRWQAANGPRERQGGIRRPVGLGSPRPRGGAQAGSHHRPRDRSMDRHEPRGELRARPVALHLRVGGRCFGQAHGLRHRWEGVATHRASYLGRGGTGAALSFGVGGRPNTRSARSGPDASDHAPRQTRPTLGRSTESPIMVRVQHV